MKKLVTTIALLLWASQAWAQQSTQAGGTGCSTPATAARLGVMSPTIGTVCTITDGASATDCTTGGGTDKVTCFYCGAAWQSSSCGGASGGTDVALDLGDTGSNDSAAINEIATSGDTNNIFTEPAADKLLIDVSQNWPVCDAATAADDLSGSCNQCVDISANTNLSVGAGLFLNPTNDEITVISNASGFLHDGGATSLTCSGLPARIQVMDDGSLEYCDGAATSVLQSYDPGTTLTAGTGLSGDFVIDTSSTINCADAAADGTTKGCSTFGNTDFADDGSGLITIKDKFVLTDGDVMSGQLRIDLSGNVPLVLTDTDNAASGQVLRLIASGQSTPTTGDGGFINFRTENAANTVADACRIEWEWNDATDGSEDGELVFSCSQNSGTGELFRTGFNGSTNANFTINPASKDINFIVKDSAGSDTLTCDGTTGVCDFANSPTVAGVADPTYVAVTGDAMSGVLNIDTTAVNALQVFVDTGGNANYAQMGCSGNGSPGGLCNLSLSADNLIGNEVIVAQLQHAITDLTNTSLDGRVRMLVKQNGQLEEMQDWESTANGVLTNLFNPVNLDVDFRIDGDFTDGVFACDGSTEVCSFLNPPTGLSETTMTKFQTGAPGFNGTSTQELAESAHCVKWFVPGRIADADTMDFVLTSTGGTGAAEVVELGTYSADGQTQYFECRLPTSSGTGSLNCSNDNATPAAIPPGDVWMCVTTSTGDVEFVSMHASTYTGRYCTFTQTVTTGELPNTLTSPSCTWTNLLPAYLGLSDE